MAHTDNFFNIKGKVGNLIFCTRNGKSYVKTYSGGFVNGNAHAHPNAKASRNKFSQVARFAANFKKAILPLLWRQTDGSFHNQLVSLFSHIKKRFPEDDLYENLQKPEVLNFIKQQSLNKNHQLPQLAVRYDAKKNQLQINPKMLQSYQKKYPDAQLEVAFCWLTITNDYAVIPSEIEIHILEIFGKDNATSVIIPTSSSTESGDQLQWPFVTLSLISKTDALQRGFHPQHTMWCGIV